MPAAGLTFRIASEPGEIEQIHRLNYRSEYLQARNIVQSCLMGHMDDAQCCGLAAALADALAGGARASGSRAARVEPRVSGAA